MATLSSFPNNADEYIGAHEVMRWLHGRTSGVYAGSGNAAVSAVAGEMKVSVAAGIGWITDASGDGIVWWFDSAQTLDIDPADPNGEKSRIDRVVVQWHIGDYEYKPELVVLTGTPAYTDPQPPALTNSSTDRMISLAQVYISKDATYITAGDITDERLDPDVCGLVTETVTADTSMINSQYQVALAQLENAIAQAWSGVISDGAITFAKLAAALQYMIEDKVLYLTSVACSATTGDFASVSNAKITADHVVAECVFANPSAITTDVTWTTASGSVKLNGTCASATTVNLVLVKKDN